jgi:protein-S-isoprenylcysteine O-methyltransferase Ste14
MAKSERPLLADLEASLGRLAADARAMLALRWELARRELQADARTVRQLAIAAGIAALMAVTALPILIVAAVEGLGLPRAAWLGAIGLALLIAAGILATTAWRRCRRQLTAMAQSREELCEDLVWLREMTGMTNDGDNDE